MAGKRTSWLSNNVWQHRFLRHRHTYMVAHDTASGTIMWFCDPLGLIRHTPRVAEGIIFWGRTVTMCTRWTPRLATSFGATRSTPPCIRPRWLPMDSCTPQRSTRALFALDALTGEIIWHDKMPGTKLPAFMDKVGELLIFETFPRHWIPPPEQWLGISRKTSSQPED